MRNGLRLICLQNIGAPKSKRRANLWINTGAGWDFRRFKTSHEATTFGQRSGFAFYVRESGR